MGELCPIFRNNTEGKCATFLWSHLCKYCVETTANCEFNWVFNRTSYYIVQLNCPIVFSYFKWHWVTFVLPAGITVDKYGVIFFVDGTMIRRIDQNGIISTLLGFNDLTSARPLSCDAVMDISQVWPFWPVACDLLSTYTKIYDLLESVMDRIPISAFAS